MVLKIFCVFDQKAKAYLPPFCMTNEAVACRVFADCVNDQGHAFGRNPKDYTLFEMGEFDDGSGTLESHQVPLVVGSGLEFVENSVSEDQLKLRLQDG